MNKIITEKVINLLKNEKFSYEIYPSYDGYYIYYHLYSKCRLNIDILENINGISKISIIFSDDYDTSSVFEYEYKYDKENFNLLLNAITDFFKRNPDLYKKLKKDKKEKINRIISSKRKVVKHLREDIINLKNLLKAVNTMGIK